MVLNVDFPSLQNQEDGILLADLGTRCNDLPTGIYCPLCDLFYQSRLQSKGLPSEYQLRVYSYLKTSQKIAFGFCRDWHRSKDVACLGVVPTGMKAETFRFRAENAERLFCLDKSQHDTLLFNPRILGQNADLSLAKDWLNFCISRHSLCQNDKCQVTGLKLVNCETYEVVSAPENASYVALSYVWGATTSHHGEPSNEEDGSPSLDLRFTKTIRDALVVVKALGHKYLWVDKFCIDQKNAEEKHDQISQMDSIYGGADVTIISACGQDCHYGLPGVNGTSRTAQRAVNIGRINIFSSVVHPHRRIHSSKWAGRGWTLQETILSTRRVVFTEDQLYFECNSMDCSESMAPNIDLIHSRDGMIHPSLQSGILSMDAGCRFTGTQPDD
ncbi:MAG: hypothetical protein M1821_002442 [Bathelium mastoideum]|nr:MAG: hypothetical protein M1821_002442 [Bathelium mastoideum]